MKDAVKNKPKFTPKRRSHKWIFPVAGVFMGFLCISTILLSIRYVFCGGEDKAVLVGVVLNTLVAALGFFAIYLSIQNDKEIKRFEYIADYNFNFLTNSEFITVERLLETCNQEYLRIDRECKSKWKPEQEKKFMAFCDDVFDTFEYRFTEEPGGENSRIDKDNCISESYQKIVNYLVYLESFVPLIIHKQLKLDEVDDLFGYRYFIAMNNPVLQVNELCRERPDYRGCFEAYSLWMDHRKKDLRGCVIPMEHYDLLEVWDKYKAEHPEARE